METTTERQVLTTSEVATQLGLSEASVYKGIGCGQIPAIRVGRRLLIPRDAFQQLLAPKRPPAVLNRQRVLKKPKTRAAAGKTAEG